MMARLEREQGWPVDLDVRARQDMNRTTPKMHKVQSAERPHRVGRISEILEAVAQEHMVAVAAILSPSRNRATVAARREAAHILRSRGLSLPHIGRILKRDHSTVINLLSRRDRKIRPVKSEDVPKLVYRPNQPDLSGEWAI